MLTFQGIPNTSECLPDLLALYLLKNHMTHGEGPFQEGASGHEDGYCFLTVPTSLPGYCGGRKQFGHGLQVDDHPCTDGLCF